jgi:magnesium transporter
MNEIMKTLTIVSTVFIPLSFIAGIYGMNFEYIPELKWLYGYFYTWGMMITVTTGIFAYFKKKKWF